MGEQHCHALLAKAAGESDVILVESMMGPHDNQPSDAQLARLFGLSVTLIIDVAKFAQTAAAIVSGMRRYDVGANITAVIGNKVVSDNHDLLMRHAFSNGNGDCYAGSIRRDSRFEIAERHLGLVQAGDIESLDKQLDQAANALDEFEISAALSNITFLSPSLSENKGDAGRLLEGKTIAIAKDAAFSFIYPMNQQVLEEMGAKLRYFSPLENDVVPDCDALWIPGGYPELHLDVLSKSDKTRTSILDHHGQTKPILAECGGMMYMCNSIVNNAGEHGRTCGILNANCEMKARFQSVGLQQVNYGMGDIRGHSFHHSTIVLEGDDVDDNACIAPALFATKKNGEVVESIYRVGNATLSYMHHYFASNILASAALLTS
jgi:cobyrinic acid a,c-diamide synthase